MANHNAVAEKARVLESHGAKGGIVLDNNPDSSSQGSNIFARMVDKYLFFFIAHHGYN